MSILLRKYCLWPRGWGMPAPTKLFGKDQVERRRLGKCEIEMCRPRLPLCVSGAEARFRR